MNLEPMNTKLTHYQIEARGSNATVAFAAQELKNYLTQMLEDARFAITSREDPDQPGFVVAEARDVADAVLPGTVRDGGDLDQIFILSRGPQVVLAGNNPRSVLFAVYDFLERLGCRWLHPGPGGEKCRGWASLPLTNWKVTETASFRYRGV